MKPNKASYLLHPLFITGLVLLILNDQFWKTNYHNWFTGKLSDFAGLTVFCLLITSIIPRFKNFIFIVTAILFTWWKSEYAQSFIDLMTTSFRISFTRVVDYSDLIALVILPFVWKIKPVALPQFRFAGIARFIIGVIGFAAIYADTPPRYLYGNTDSYYVYKTFHVSKSKDQVLKKLEELGYTAQKDSGRLYSITSDDLYLKIKDSTGEKTIKLTDYEGIGVYRRAYTDNSSYFLPWFNVGNDTLTNLQFSIVEETVKQTRITLRGFDYDGAPDSTYRQRREIIKKFRKSVKHELQEILK